MSHAERYITIASLINAAIFYAITVIVFLVARKTRLNKALALQKFDWLLIILFIALPAYVAGYPVLPGKARMLLWCLLSASTWLVLYEVYRANWYEGWRCFLVTLARETLRLPSRAWQKTRTLV